MHRTPLLVALSDLLLSGCLSIKEGLHNLLRVRIAALRGVGSLAYLLDMSRSLRSVRLALRPLATVVQTFLSTSETPSPDVAANACQGREQLCRELCGNAGVQSFTCNAGPA